MSSSDSASPIADIAWPASAILAGLVLALALWLLLPPVDTDGSVPDVVPPDWVGLALLVAVPSLVAYFLVRDVTPLATFPIGYLPVFTYYRFLYHHASHAGGIGLQFPLFEPEVYVLATGYWLVGVILAVAYSVVWQARERPAATA